MTEAVPVPGATSGVSAICWRMIKYWGTPNKMVPSVPTCSDHNVYIIILYTLSFIPVY